MVQTDKETYGYTGGFLSLFVGAQVFTKFFLQMFFRYRMAIEAEIISLGG